MSKMGVQYLWELEFSLLDINLKKLEPLIPWDLQEYNVQTPNFFFLGHFSE
jgi:hypothetical protein